MIFPDEVKGYGIKIWTKENYVHLGRYETKPGVFTSTFGGGTYKIEGNRCTGIRKYHTMTNLVGTTARWLIEIKNDTLIQQWPVIGENWTLGENPYEEIWVRIE